MTIIFEMAHFKKILPEVNASSIPQIISAKTDDNDLMNLKKKDFCSNKMVVASILSASQSKLTYDYIYF